MLTSITKNKQNNYTYKIVQAKQKTEKEYRNISLQQEVMS